MAAGADCYGNSARDGTGFDWRTDIFGEDHDSLTGEWLPRNVCFVMVGNQFAFTRTLRGKFVFSASGPHLTQTRNSNLGFALAFPFSSTSLTVSGFETFGENQFATPITFFPSLRNQEKYQFRYDLSSDHGRHVFKAGVNLIHEPVLGGTFRGNTETPYQLPQNPGTAFQAVNAAPGPCVDPVANPGWEENAGCVAGVSSGGVANLIDSHYRTPYAIRISGERSMRSTRTGR